MSCMLCSAHPPHTPGLKHEGPSEKFCTTQLIPRSVSDLAAAGFEGSSVELKSLIFLLTSVNVTFPC